jgi:hypothetical protein
MKHIRLFEGFSNDEYYIKITLEDYLILRSESSEGYDCLLSDREKLWIEKNLPIKSMCWQYSWHEDIFPDSTIKIWDVARDIAIGASYGSGTVISIYKIEDDYFLCSLNEDDNIRGIKSGMQYYKCDQWEGFIMLLNDKKVI